MTELEWWLSEIDGPAIAKRINEELFKRVVLESPQLSKEKK